MGKGISILYKYDTLGFEVIPVLDERGRMLLAGISNTSFVNSKVFITKLNVERSFDIDVEDTANFTFEYDSFSVTFNTSFVQNRQERIIKINGQDGWIEYDLLEQRVTKNGKDHYNKITNDDLFLLQSQFYLNEFSKSDDSYINSLISNAKIIDKIADIN